MTGRRGTLNDTGPPTNLSHDPLERVVGAYLLPVDVREGVVGERFGHAPFDEVGRRVHPGGAPPGETVFFARMKDAGSLCRNLTATGHHSALSWLGETPCRRLRADGRARAT